MKKIVILRCLKSEENCTGAACLKALNNKKAYFSCYADEELELVGFCACNGCETIKFDGTEGMNEKLERILSIRPDTVHIGICCQTRTSDKNKCAYILEMADFFKRHNIKIVWGTHSY
jgi:predicted metal-binding protein